MIRCIAALYDIHGNIPALEAVLREIEQEAPDFIVVGGDIASGPQPREAIDRLMELGSRVRAIRGNADREIVDAFDGRPFASGTPAAVREVTTWAARQLATAQRDFLAALPPSVTLTVDGLGDVLFCHGSPRSDEEIITAATPEDRVGAMLDGVEPRLVVCGHTHMQFDRSIGGTRLVNAGSVGMPYGEPGAYWLLLDPGVQLRRTMYDLDAAARHIRASDYPRADDFAAHNVLAPPTVAQALDAFEGRSGD